MDTSSNLAWCYRVLELTTDATEQEIKTAYKKLARKYHPDLNPSDRAKAEAQFKLISLAYQTLISARQQPNTQNRQYYTSNQPASPTPTVSSRVRFHVKHPQQRKVENISFEQRLYKASTLNQIYSLLKRKKWQQAIEVAENLTTDFPGDTQVSEWLAVVYHRWARKLIERQHYDHARIYLKKALQADPHNKQLWLAIDQDYRNMEHQLRL